MLVYTAFIGLFPSAEERMCDHCVARQCCWHRGMLKAATPCVAHRKSISQRRRHSRIFQEAISICALNALMWIIFWNIQQGFQLFASRLRELHLLHTAKEEGQQKQRISPHHLSTHTCTEGLSWIYLSICGYTTWNTSAHCAYCTARCASATLSQQDTNCAWFFNVLQNQKCRSWSPEGLSA